MGSGAAIGKRLQFRETMPTQFAPIAVFAYRRTAHLAAVLDSLERCPGFASSDVYIFSDGPRDDAAAADVQSVRQMLALRMRSNMTVVEAPRNRGLANSIIAGVTDLCNQYGRAIVIEDDLVVSPALLTWFNGALDRYQNESAVWQVSGHQFAVPQFRERCDGAFLNFSTSWGWATWARAWRGFDPSATGWEALGRDPVLRDRFDLHDAYPYASMLEQQMTGKIDSWAIRWWWSMFCANALALFPPRTLVSNIGQDGTATHQPSRLVQMLRPMQTASTMDEAPDFPAIAALDEIAQKALETQLRRMRSPGWARALMARLK